jgi:hypothetical protein
MLPSFKEGSLSTIDWSENPGAGHQVASFAKAITRDEFGRFYWDERRESEVRRSLASAMARVKQERRARAKLLAKAKK